MPIQIIEHTDQHDETLTYKFQDAEIHYRRVPSDLYEMWQKKHTNMKGVCDDNAVAREMIKYAVKGWAGFVDHEQKPVEYEPRLFWSLPQIIQNGFTDVLLTGLRPEDGAEDEVKNSSTTRSSSSE